MARWEWYAASRPRSASLPRQIFELVGRAENERRLWLTAEHRVEQALKLLAT
ncbi:hypothetical protein [Streptomyces sp. NPDC005828]|uniref:hypothetical protein n=1 Tax=Streptomyces sp. NPDC005828 TaxID=3157071 RepID=UPI0033E16DB7